MKVVFSGIGVVNGTGKLGGTVFQNGRFGSVARRWVRGTTVNIPNFNANDEKLMFQKITSRWRTLTPTQQNSWTPTILTGLSGFNTYTSRNLVYYRQNGVYLDVKPLDNPAPLNSLFSFDIDSGTQQFTVRFFNNSFVVNQNMTFFLVINLSSGILLPRKSLFRYSTSVGIGAGLNTNTLSLPPNFPAIIVNGNCFCKCVPQDTNTGQAFAPQILQSIAT